MRGKCEKYNLKIFLFKFVVNDSDFDLILWKIQGDKMVIAYPDYACYMASAFAGFFAVFGTAGEDPFPVFLANFSSPKFHQFLKFFI